MDGSHDNPTNIYCLLTRHLPRSALLLPCSPGLPSDSPVQEGSVSAASTKSVGLNLPFVEHNAGQKLPPNTMRRCCPGSRVLPLLGISPYVGIKIGGTDVIDVGRTSARLISGRRGGFPPTVSWLRPGVSDRVCASLGGPQGPLILSVSDLGHLQRGLPLL